MATARELLEQADALMRRNREQDGEPEIPEIPELTDKVPLDAIGGSARARPASTPTSTVPRGRTEDADVPVLTDSVADIGVVVNPRAPELEGEVSRWLEVELGEASITGPAPDSIAVVPPATLRTPPPGARPAERGAVVDARAPAAPPVAAPSPPPEPPPSAARTLASLVAAAPVPPRAARAPDSDPTFDAMLGEPSLMPVDPEPSAAEAAFDNELAPAPGEVPEQVASPGAELPSDDSVEPTASVVAASSEPRLAGDAAQWDALAEEIRMQVLQRIDIFTDTGLHEQLTARLQPIVDRASADLVVTINQHVGQLLRAYVAEAIEREIEKWRQGNT